MRRGLIHSAAWLLATGAAVTLSWWGVHTVMSGTVYDPPRALPIPSVIPTAEERVTAAASATPRSSSTHRPSPTPTAKKPPAAPSGDRASRRPPARTPAPPPPAQPSGELKAVSTEGGRVLFSLGKDSAKLLSAVPEAGWAVQVWKDPSWIRVQFTAGGATVTVFCTWHHHPPMIETVTS
ncbi:hypothetical protein [Streptomyces sp. NPDC058657]|uniref:hypothetical protein n=1 Tax=unclassified Streptomyces TaxID=2593676 RepID=UPI003649BC76